MPGWRWSDEFNRFYKTDGPLTEELVRSFDTQLIEIEQLSLDDAMLTMVDDNYRAKLKTLIKISYHQP